MKEKYQNLSENKKNLIMICIALSILIIFLLCNSYSNYMKTKKEYYESKQKKIVTDYNRYFTALNCINKYIEVLQNKISDDLLSIIQPEYIKNNKIDNKNIFEHVRKLDNDYLYSYSCDQMYQKRISKNITEFYVKGNIKKATLNETLDIIPSSLTVVLYENTMTFSIIPEIIDHD